MNADHAAQLRLLDLQALDTELAQLAHRRSHLPALAALTVLAGKAEEIEAEASEQDFKLEDLTAEQRKLEADVDNVRARTTRDQQRMEKGGLPSNELVSLQHEIETLGRRQSSLEDDLLEVMEQIEEAETARAKTRAAQEDLAKERSASEADRDAAFAEIDAASAAKTAQRSQVAGEIPEDLRALYERVRQHSGGVGAAMLRARRCEGCRIELSGSDLAAIRAAAPEKVVRCENCGRILVRTSESGL